MKNRLMKSSLFLFCLQVIFSVNVVGADSAKAADQGGDEVCPVSAAAPDKLTIDNDSKEEFQDLDRDVKDFGTKFVIQEFFKTETTLFNFIKFTYGTIDSAIKKYREEKGLDEKAIVFLFKGGNVMRILANEVFTRVSDEARDILKEAYEKDFTRSDSDFTVVVDNKLLKGNDYDKTIKDLTDLTYKALNDLRAEFASKPAKYFDFAQFDVEQGSKELSKYFALLPELEAVKNPDNPNWYGAQFKQLQLLKNQATDALSCKYDGQFDYAYEFASADHKEIIGTPLTKRANWMMNTINRTLTWSMEDDPSKVVAFDLVRAKLQLLYVYRLFGKLMRKFVGGELIDVSFTKKEDFRLQTFIDNLDKWVTFYTLTTDATGESMKFYAESIEGIAADLHEVVFGQFSRPWEARKYEKRLRRIFFFFVTQMIQQHGIGSDKSKAYLDGIKTKIVEPMTKLYPLQQDASMVVGKIKQEIEALKASEPNMHVANELLEVLPTLLSRLIATPKADDTEKFGEFLKLMQDNLEVLSKISSLKPQAVNLDTIYNANMKSFL